MVELAKPLARVGTRLESLWLELTQKCNLACNHCYADSHVGRDLFGSMGQKDWASVLDAADAMGCAFIQFIGGEPILHPSLEELAGKAKQLGMEVEVLTNGTILPARTLEWMSALQVSVSTSVYAACADDHDAVTGRPGSWKRTVANIDRMIGHGIPVRAGIIYRDWERERVPETTAFLEARGVAVGSDRVREVGRGRSTRTAEAYLATLCGACGDRRLCVTNTGEVYPCIMARETPLGNVTLETLEAIIARQALAEFRDALARASGSRRACTPDCWPHGGCAPHDVCNPHKAVAGEPVRPHAGG
jgi:radical SAM protein with 4Fe4S-binding SPASM domain